MESLTERESWAAYVAQASGVIELDEESSIARLLRQAVEQIAQGGGLRADSGALRPEALKGSVWAGLDPSFPPFALNGFSEQRDWRNQAIRQRHFAIMIPARLTRPDGSEEAVLFSALARLPAKLGDKPEPFCPGHGFFKKIKVGVSRNAAEAKRASERFGSRTATQGYKLAAARWSLDELFALSRIEREALNKELPEAPKRRAASI